MSYFIFICVVSNPVFIVFLLHFIFVFYFVAIGPFPFQHSQGPFWAYFQAQLRPTELPTAAVQPGPHLPRIAAPRCITFLFSCMASACFLSLHASFPAYVLCNQRMNLGRWDGNGEDHPSKALVLAKREVLRTIDEPNGSSLTPASLTDLPMLIGTFVICPVVAVSQWVSESDRFTSKGSTKVLVYHGANRSKAMTIVWAKETDL